MQTELKEEAEAYKKKMENTVRFLIGQISMKKGQLKTRQEEAQRRQDKVNKTLSDLHQLEMELKFVKGLFSKETILTQAQENLKKELDGYAAGKSRYMGLNSEESKALSDWKKSGKPMMFATPAQMEIDSEEFGTLGEFEKGEHNPSLTSKESDTEKYAGLLNTANTAMNKGWTLSDKQINFMLVMLLKYVVKEN